MAYNVIEKEIKKKIHRIELDNRTHRVYECPVCGIGKTYVDNSVFYGRCNNCEATMFDFEPLPHQMDYLMSPTTYKLLIGGFGSGKTTVAVFDTAYHALTIPNARILITAQTLQQMKAAILPELDKFLPPWFLVGGRSKGNPPVYTLYNGSEIHVYPSDDEEKIRSLNLTRFHIEEGSGVKKSVFDQLQARLRNSAAVIYDENGREIGNKLSGVVSTNPEDSWIREDFLLRSKKIKGSASVDVSVYEPFMSNDRVDLFETFISASFDNVMLPKGTIERISAGKDDRWKRKYLWSYLDVREGLVFGDILKNTVEPFEIPRNWKRIGGFDPGISDPTAFLVGAIDPMDNTIYIYDEYYERDKSISEHGHALRPMIDPYSWYLPISADPSINKRSQQTGIAYRQFFRQQTGINLNPVNNDLLYGIEKVRDYIYNGKIKFFDDLVNTKKEASMYAFPEPNARNTNINNKPMDKDNHLMDSLRYMIVPLPDSPSDFRSVYRQADIHRDKFYSGFKAESPKDFDSTGITYGFKRGG